MHTLLKSQSQAPLGNPPCTHHPQGRDRISANLRRKLLFLHYSQFDWQEGGLPGPIKFLERDSIEYSLCQAAAYDRNEERMARLCLDRGLALIDKADGGIYQFASGPDWEKCRYTKSIAAQAGSLRLYSLAYAQLKEYRYLTAARNICRYIEQQLLGADGLFKSHAPAGKSTNAPPVAPRSGTDRQICRRDNGWLIEALASHYEFCDEPRALVLAGNAIQRLGPGPGCAGTMSHERWLVDGSLAETLALARASLQLYRCTAEGRFLDFAKTLARALAKTFAHPECGFTTTAPSQGAEQTTRQIDENICAARFLNLLYHYTGDATHLEQARQGMRYLSIPAVALSRPVETGILLLDEELAETPVKITILAGQNDELARKLRSESLRSFGWYKVIHWAGDTRGQAL